MRPIRATCKTPVETPAAGIVDIIHQVELRVQCSQCDATTQPLPDNALLVLSDGRGHKQRRWRCGVVLYKSPLGWT
ncbi:hypothetical protein J6590_055548 [Homalodisca vitripennis]|nr:hypothetical protein J6590_055548 [Homalodisca vitripennis]